MRILGRGTTAQAIKILYPNAKLYDDINLNEFDQKSDELTIVSPGIPPYHHLVVNTNNLISEYDLFENIMPYSIWISGTNGKTTTTKMLQHLLKEYNSVCGGNIGIPLASMDIKANIWILETSSFTLHYTNKAKPNIYVLLPISDDHISWHTTFKNYEQSKLKALDNLNEGEIAIVPTKYKDYPTAGYKICYNNAIDLAQYFDIDINKINFKEPFLLDAILALSISKILFDTIDYKKINYFIQDSNKIEEFKDNKKRLWIDDSKATNINATIEALKKYNHKKIFLILGGDDKGANLELLFEELKQYNIKLFTIGKNTKKLFDLSNKYHIQCIMSKRLKNAVDSIFNDSSFGDTNTIAILSPAAASLDQFNSYKHRGKEFKKYVLGQ